MDARSAPVMTDGGRVLWWQLGVGIMLALVVMSELVIHCWQQASAEKYATRYQPLATNRVRRPRGFFSVVAS
jgi:hypothetical protein